MQGKGLSIDAGCDLARTVCIIMRLRGVGRIWTCPSVGGLAIPSLELSPPAPSTCVPVGGLICKGMLVLNLGEILDFRLSLPATTRSCLAFSPPRELKRDGIFTGA